MIVLAYALTERSIRNRTLNGGRAERNEYILLHEFHRLKYICPDKFQGKNRAALIKAEVEEGNSAAMSTGGGKAGGKRDKFKGGLVFEPKRGLWDKFVLVMDFNSLYPSIIQEYNIDFTTISVITEEDVSGMWTLVSTCVLTLVSLVRWKRKNS